MHQTIKATFSCSYISIIADQSKSQARRPSPLFSDFGCCISKESSFRVIYKSQKLLLCRVKRLPIHRYNAVTFTVSAPLGLWVTTFNWKQSITQTRAWRREGCRIFRGLSLEV